MTVNPIIEQLIDISKQKFRSMKVYDTKVIDLDDQTIIELMNQFCSILLQNSNIQIDNIRGIRWEIMTPDYESAF